VKKLITAEAQIEDLKMQVDDAVGAEEMLVQLTERNLELGEVHFSENLSMLSGSLIICFYQKIEEMRLSIEELEMLKELADELEEQHIETEKALQEDLGSLMFYIS
jgi:dynactin 1